MKYVQLKKDICDNLTDIITQDDFFLLEGKLIFISHEQATQVKNYLEQTYNVKMHMQPTRNWPHWDTQYETEMWVENL